MSDRLSPPLASASQASMMYGSPWSRLLRHKNRNPLLHPPAVMPNRTFQTKACDRWGDTVSPDGILDMALRGTREQWFELYEVPRSASAFRA